MFHVKGFGALTFDEITLECVENLDGMCDQIEAIVMGLAEPVSC